MRACALQLQQVRAKFTRCAWHAPKCLLTYATFLAAWTQRYCHRLDLWHRDPMAERSKAPRLGRGSRERRFESCSDQFLLYACCTLKKCAKAHRVYCRISWLQSLQPSGPLSGGGAGKARFTHALMWQGLLDCTRGSFLPISTWVCLWGGAAPCSDCARCGHGHAGCGDNPCNISAH